VCVCIYFSTRAPSPAFLGTCLHTNFVSKRQKYSRAQNFTVSRPWREPHKRYMSELGSAIRESPCALSRRRECQGPGSASGPVQIALSRLPESWRSWAREDHASVIDHLRKTELGRNLINKVQYTKKRWQFWHRWAQIKIKLENTVHHAFWWHIVDPKKIYFLQRLGFKINNVWGSK